MLNVDSEQAGRGSRSKPIKWLQHKLGGLTWTLYPIITKTDQPGEKAPHQLAQRVWTNPIQAAHWRVSFCSLAKFNLKTKGFCFLFHINRLTVWGCRTCSVVFVDGTLRYPASGTLQRHMPDSALPYLC